MSRKSISAVVRAFAQLFGNPVVAVERAPVCSTSPQPTRLSFDSAGVTPEDLEVAFSIR